MGSSIKPPIIQGFDQNILQDAVITSTVAPVSTYVLNKLGLLMPSERVVFPTGTVTVRFTLPQPLQGDVFFLSVGNFNTGTAHWSNVAGGGTVNELLVPGTLRRNGHRDPVAVDLTINTPSAPNRVSSIWELVVSGNPIALRLGGAIACYSPRTSLIDRGFRWEYDIQKTAGGFTSQNEYLTIFKQATLTGQRLITLITPATENDAGEVDDWIDANYVSMYPGLLWTNVDDPSTAFLGYFQSPGRRKYVYFEFNEMEVAFLEMQRGVPLLNPTVMSRYKQEDVSVVDVLTARMSPLFSTTAIGENVKVSDSVTARLAVETGVPASENVKISDTVTRALQLAQSNSENVKISESVTATIV